MAYTLNALIAEASLLRGEPGLVVAPLVGGLGLAPLTGAMVLQADPLLGAEGLRAAPDDEFDEPGERAVERTRAEAAFVRISRFSGSKGEFRRSVEYENAWRSTEQGQFVNPDARPRTALQSSRSAGIVNLGPAGTPRRTPRRANDKGHAETNSSSGKRQGRPSAALEAGAVHR
ncbi:hypothetical protein [Nannocystis punicea]|uniref:Uncharacterized protein n=1 Tax=Nannocystis punicea TaxID=2995304 RepID=A0ABY7HBN2_9BACT|nr:hypothetical protein [Nannocystis poenicansa]WAS96667.1 hypothetical protein O0S08_10995 [Nannocystis poenicansa]